MVQANSSSFQILIYLPIIIGNYYSMFSICLSTPTEEIILKVLSIFVNNINITTKEVQIISNPYLLKGNYSTPLGLSRTISYALSFVSPASFSLFILTLMALLSIPNISQGHTLDAYSNEVLRSPI